MAREWKGSFRYEGTSLVSLVCFVFLFVSESQFYRLVNTTDKYRVTKVEYVVNPVLIRRFQKSRQKLKNARGEETSYPVLAFHGTKETNIHSICNTGFRAPGDANFEHATDTGEYDPIVGQSLRLRSYLGLHVSVKECVPEWQSPMDVYVGSYDLGQNVMKFKANSSSPPPNPLRNQGWSRAFSHGLIY